MKKLIYIGLVLILSLPLAAQQNQEEYIKVLTERSDKIVKTLNITDKAKYDRVVEILVDQYSKTGKIHDDNDLKNKSIKESSEIKEIKDKQIQDSFNELMTLLYNQHCNFIGRLYSELNHDQVEKVKDGITFNVLNVTYKAMLDMIPSLKEDEKRYIWASLLEAREHALLAASSDGRHAWFGKFKGRINNYLAAKGYDLKKERDGWNERLKAAKK